MTIFYRILQAVVGVALAILLWFFFAGLADGSIDASNMGLWLILLAVPVAALVISHHLWGRNQRAAACVLLAVPAAPTLLYGLFVGLFIALDPKF